jgi:hypothetical protein
MVRFQHFWLESTLKARNRQDSLRKNIKTDGKRRWLPIDSYILIHKSVYSPLSIVVCS